ncbi:MAG TPA: hypothetical protein VLM75_05845 [Spirochaetota bacterium]|nr:hypothetical protein [Spirochaetota bacterium]
MTAFDWHNVVLLHHETHHALSLWFNSRASRRMELFRAVVIVFALVVSN